MVKTYSFPDELGQTIRQALQRNMSVAVDVALIGNYPEAEKLINAVGKSQLKPVEKIDRGVLVRLWRDRIDYSIRARGAIAPGEWGLP